MAPTKVILLACGSFNPPTNMHLRIFEIARDHLNRMGTYIVVGGIISPVHDGYGKKELESSTHRINMIHAALSNSDWVKLSDWECKQQSWSRTRQVLQYHQNIVNLFLHPSQNCTNDINEREVMWIPENLKNGCRDPVVVKLLCGADLLESFGTPGLWADEDIDAIVGQHGLVVITRIHTKPEEFIYNSDLLTKYMGNITIVTEWIRNEVSSTKIRRAIRRSESVRYLIPDKVIEYIVKNGLYGCGKTEYLTISNNEKSSVFLTPSPTDASMESPSPNSCLYICNNNPFSRSANFDKRINIDMVDTYVKSNLKHPGQAVKIITGCSGEHKIVRSEEINKNEVSIVERKIKTSKSCAALDEASCDVQNNTTGNLKECKSCDENLVKFIFTKHGIQVISDVETIV